ncbi:hypothetical protein AB0N88_20575 [Streptomyces sp. NPDC093516]|uniref:hypothetical protein n=1 Tax=Streptomyces sp. NPDC093516 TaxID=3155304 RepID=UPI0034329491
MRTPWRKTTVPWSGLCLWSAMAALVVAVCSIPGRDGGDQVARGRVCRSTLPRGMELSCATYGFGDLRYRCPKSDADGRPCVRTSGVTVRNRGRTRVYVTYIAGVRQGVREQGPQRALEPGAEITLRPGGRRWLYDITLRGTEEGPKILEVVRVR